ncbi:hypothetical protein L3Q65_00620 (plasmid) [Amycolatopsis sp. FU40]|uniref:hypothetical protein n=1 Tax=Amycolatopsis sp. FU40 TaxID=2914159 RepID=UPI001F3A9A46|nr:hypothetical protein [Amycolatopsis sp. FU40]UKD50832.1 hypothetical protein L3Q65_00620 [Amycolatopsis sp. FU40]
MACRHHRGRPVAYRTVDGNITGCGDFRRKSRFPEADSTSMLLKFDTVDDFANNITDDGFPADKVKDAAESLQLAFVQHHSSW